jgi:cephalosporin-C deacetylase
MPILDKPLEELRVYRGINPKPPDFDEFWDRALGELDALGTTAELEPADFRAPCAECFHLRFRGVGGARVYAKYLRPRAGARPHPAVLMFHGYTGSSGDWSDKLPWVALGYSVAALDCRGQGGLSDDPGGVSGNTQAGHIVRGLEQGPESLLYRSIFLDTAQLARIVMAMDDVDPRRVGATGGSQGGALTLACAALEPRVRKAAPVYPFLCDYKRVWEMDRAERAYAELKKHFRLFDPTHEREDELFTRLGYIDVQFLCPRIRAEVLMTTCLLDDVCPPSTQFAAYNRITAPKRMVIYPDFGHESLPGSSDRIFGFLSDL